MAADSAGKDDVNGAIQKLAAADNYSWTTTTESTLFKPGPSHGKTEKGGYTYVEFSMQDNKLEAVVKGDKSVVKTGDGWQTLEEAAQAQGDGGFNAGRFMSRRMKDYKLPAAEAQDYAGKSKEIAKADGAYAGDLTEEGAKALITATGRRGGGPPPAITNPRGSVKFWIKDGVLTKYQINVKGSVDRDGEEVKIDRTTTVEIKDIGTTKIEVPDEAKKKLS
jgi:hypothetical protein